MGFCTTYLGVVVKFWFWYFFWCMSLSLCWLVCKLEDPFFLRFEGYNLSNFSLHVLVRLCLILILYLLSDIFVVKLKPFVWTVFIISHVTIAKHVMHHLVSVCQCGLVNVAVGFLFVQCFCKCWSFSFHVGVCSLRRCGFHIVAI